MSERTNLLCVGSMDKFCPNQLVASFSSVPSWAALRGASHEASIRGSLVYLLCDNFNPPRSTDKEKNAVLSWIVKVSLEINRVVLLSLEQN